jgi:N-methylhydantoinase A
LLEAEPRIDATTTKVMRLTAESMGEIAAVYRMLEAQVQADMQRHGQIGEPRWSRYAQMRYAGQGFEVKVDLPDGPIDPSYAARAMQAFKDAYMRKHRFLDAEGAIEAVDWTLVAAIDFDRAHAGLGRTMQGAPRSGMRRAWFPETGGYGDTPVVDRRTLAARGRIAGPAIIEDPDSTAVILPGDIARISEAGNVIIDIGGAAAQ